MQILYRLTTMFHVLHQALGPKLELTSHPAWGEHCRKEALTHNGSPGSQIPNAPYSAGAST